MTYPDPPELRGLDEFRAWAADKPVEVRREYQWPAEGDEIGYWQVFVVREELRFDGKLYAFMMTVDDSSIARQWVEQWETMYELLCVGWEQTLRENLVSDEDERIFQIAGTPSDEEHPSPDDIAFLIAVIHELKGQALQMQEALREEFRAYSALKRELDEVTASE